MRYVIFLLVLCSCTHREATYPGSDAWVRKCALAGGHEYKQYVYRGDVNLCLTSDGRVLEVSE